MMILSQDGFLVLVVVPVKDRKSSKLTAFGRNAKTRESLVRKEKCSFLLISRIVSEAASNR